MDATYVIAGGYTAGHLTPGLAVAEELRSRYPHLALLFAGRTDVAEAEFIRRHGLNFLALPAGPWTSQGPKARARSLAVMWPAIWKARREFRAVRAVGLLSLGSFAAVAPAMAARSLGLPLTLFEPNAEMGLANRLLRPFAGPVLASRLFQVGMCSGAVRHEVVGVPLRAALEPLAGRRPGPPGSRISLLVLGGSLGSPFLNAHAPGLAARLASLGADLRVTHQCGRETEAAAVQASYKQAGVGAVVRPFLDPIAPVLAEAGFVVTAAGAITLHEIAAAGIPLLVVPLRAAAARHQYANAEIFARRTGCLAGTEETWEEGRLASAIAAVLRDPDRWQCVSRALQAFVAGNARAGVVERIVARLPTASLGA